MKFFHTSDLHLGLKLINRDLAQDQEYILRQILRLAGQEKPDALVIAGDIYDKAIPSSEAVGMLDRFFTDLLETLPNLEILAISGNHDSAPRLDCFRTLLSRQHLHLIGLPPQRPNDHMEKVLLRDSYGEVAFYLLPFVRPSMVKDIVGEEENGNACSYDETLHRLLAREKIDPQVRNVLVAHQFFLPFGKTAQEVERMDSEIRTVGNIDQVQADVLEPFDYAALGHIHKPMSVGKEIWRYCGTPLACSVSEAGQKKGLVVVEMEEKGKTSTRVLPLTPLHEVRVISGTLEEILSQSCEDYCSLVLTKRPGLDLGDVTDRLRHAFPRLLEIRHNLPTFQAGPVFLSQEGRNQDPLSLCKGFLGDLDQDQEDLLKDVISFLQTKEQA